MKFTIENLDEVRELPPGTYHCSIVKASWDEILVRYEPDRTESLIQVVVDDLEAVPMPAEGF